MMSRYQTPLKRFLVAHKSARRQRLIFMSISSHRREAVSDWEAANNNLHLPCSWPHPSAFRRVPVAWEGNGRVNGSPHSVCQQAVRGRRPWPGWIALVGGGRHNVLYNDGGCWLRLGISWERQVPCWRSQIFCLCKSGTPFRCAPVVWIQWPTNVYVCWKDKVCLVCVCVLCVCVCSHTIENKVTEKWQIRQAIPAILLCLCCACVFACALVVFLCSVYLCAGVHARARACVCVCARARTCLCQCVSINHVYLFFWLLLKSLKLLILLHWCFSAVLRHKAWIAGHASLSWNDKFSIIEC